MSANSKIEWCDHTFNPWIGCARVSPGCDHCYAAVSTPARTMHIAWGATGPRHRTGASNWATPKIWNSGHDAFFAKHGRRQRVFCASLADVFDNAVDPIWRDDLWDLIESTPNLDWLLLTKRIGNAELMLPVPFDFDRLYPNVWLGATIVNQEEANRDIPKLLAVPARVRFLSMEPLLGAVDLDRIYGIPHNAPFSALRPSGCVQHADGYCMVDCEWRFKGIDWVIVGGESGHGARPMHSEWARDLRDQCAAAGVPFLFKQWGEWLGSHQDGAYDHEPLEFNASDESVRVGKKAAGRLLDGVEHNGFPEVAQ